MPQIILEVDTATANRIRSAFGKLRGLTTPPVLAADGVTVTTPAQPRDATLAEVKGEIRQYIKGVVQDVEAAAARAAIASPADVTIT